jgi:hypothetical protein
MPRRTADSAFVPAVIYRQLWIGTITQRAGVNSLKRCDYFWPEAGRRGRRLAEINVIDIDSRVRFRAAIRTSQGKQQ